MNAKQSSVRRENDRIARAIGMIVLGAVPAGAASQACGSTDEPAVAIDGSAADGLVGDDSLSDSSRESAADDANDAASCAITAVYFDSGRYFDAEGGGIDLSCTYDLPCGLPRTLVAVGCATFIGDPDGSPDAYVPLTCAIAEGQGCTDGSLTPGPGGHLSMTCLDCLGAGRRPRGLRPARITAQNDLGAYFAMVAHGEAASVRAFVRMENELACFAAPRALRSAARRAMCDEIRHAKVMSDLATTHGARSPRTTIRRFEKRTFEAMAIENAVEGCVNEMFGAVILAWQSRHAPSSDLRQTFRRIARDEARHAGLSWAVSAWAFDRLDSKARERVLRAQHRALRSLSEQRMWSNLQTLTDVGLPNERERRMLIDRMTAALVPSRKRAAI